MPEFIELKIDSLRVSLTNQQRIVVLKQVDADRFLPIWIGPYEAEAITIALQEIEVSRPQTHDLLNNLVTLMGGRLTRVVISSLKDDIFFGTLTVEKDGTLIEVDSRPSDAIAIAVRAHVPILAEVKVMDEASIVPEDMDTSSEEEENADYENAGSEDSTRVSFSDDRLSVFEEYFKTKSDDDETPADEDEDVKPDDDEQQSDPD
jgi:bifunctional DNase/RNase